MSGNLCRCGAHNGIVDAILDICRCGGREMIPFSYSLAASEQDALARISNGAAR